MKKYIVDIAWLSTIPINYLLMLFEKFEYVVVVQGLLIVTCVHTFFKVKKQGGVLYYLSVAMVTTIMWFACIYHSLGINYQGEVYKWTFLDCIYFSTVTWTTLGFGDFTPTADSRFYAAIEAVFGYLYSGILISIFLHWITYSNSTTKS